MANRGDASNVASPGVNHGRPIAVSPAPLRLTSRRIWSNAVITPVSADVRGVAGFDASEPTDHCRREVVVLAGDRQHRAAHGVPGSGDPSNYHRVLRQSCGNCYRFCYRNDSKAQAAAPVQAGAQPDALVRWAVLIVVEQIEGTFVGRWYVTVFGLVFVVLAVRHIGRIRTAIYASIAVVVGALAENSSVLVGFPYTRYTFNPQLRGHELWIGNVSTDGGRSAMGSWPTSRSPLRGSSCLGRTPPEAGNRSLNSCSPRCSRRGRSGSWIPSAASVATTSSASCSTTTARASGLACRSAHRSASSSPRGLSSPFSAQ